MWTSVFNTNYVPESVPGWDLMRAEQASNSVLRVDLDQVQVQVQVQVQDQLNSPAKLQAQGC